MLAELLVIKEYFFSEAYGLTMPDDIAGARASSPSGSSKPGTPWQPSSDDFKTNGGKRDDRCKSCGRVADQD